MKSLKNNLRYLAGKRALVRVDFNVSLRGSRPEADYKLRRALPTLNLLLQNNCRVVLLSHLGRPAGRRRRANSLRPLVSFLKKELRTKVLFVDEPRTSRWPELSARATAPVILLENTRFLHGEETDDPRLARRFALWGDFFVNDAFAVSHRAGASITGVAKLLPGYAGVNLENEIKFLSSVLNPPKKSVALLGGVKIETKLKVIKNFISQYERVIIGGALANIFLKAQGYNIGRSVYEPKFLSEAKRLMKSKKILLPLDCRIIKPDGKWAIVSVGSERKICNADEMIVDIGPATIERIAGLLKKSRLIVWNGPFGFIEKGYRHGTEAVIKAIVVSAARMKIAGGGETILSLSDYKAVKKFNFISTGGGAMLEFLQGGKLPGIEILNKK